LSVEYTSEMFRADFDTINSQFIERNIK